MKAKPFLYTRSIIVSVITFSASAALHAADFTMTASDSNGSTTSFNSDTQAHWNPAGAPVAGKSYSTGAFTIRTQNNGNSNTFAGDSLSIETGGRFLLKGTGSTQVATVNLILNGGTADQAGSNNSGALTTLAGTIAVNTNSRMGAIIGETLVVTSSISGSANLDFGYSTDDGTVILAANNTTYTGDITVTKGTLKIGNGGGTGSLSSSSDITNNSILHFNRSNTLTQGTDFGLLSGTGGISQTGAGTLILNGANTFTSQLAIFGGGSVSASTLNRVSGGSASSNLGTPDTVERGTIILGGSSATGTLIYSGSGETTDRSFRLQAGSAGSNGAIDQSGTTGALVITGGITSLNSANHILILKGSTDGTGEISGNITNGSGLGIAKDGSGTWTLSGTNNYTGTTSVNNGTLVVNGILANTSTTVASGAILAGNGSSAGATTISGSLRPGNSIGTFTVANDVTWNSGTAWVFELGSAAGTLSLAAVGSSVQDMLAITGANDFLRGTGTDGSFTFDFASGGETGWYKLVDWDGSTDFADAAFTATNLGSGLTGTFTVDVASSALYLNVIPEPSTVLLSSLGILGLLRRRRN